MYYYIIYCMYVLTPNRKNMFACVNSKIQTSRIREKGKDAVFIGNN